MPTAVTVPHEPANRCKFRKTHGAKYSFEYFLEKIKEINISWFEVIDTVANHIGKENCMATPFELLKQSQYEFISTFLKPILIIQKEKIKIPPPNNQGASELMMATIDYLDNEFRDIPVEHRKKIISIIEKYQKSNSSKSTLLSDAEKNEILQKYSESNKKLFSSYIQYMPLYFYEHF